MSAIIVDPTDDWINSKPTADEDDDPFSIPGGFFGDGEDDDDDLDTDNGSGFSAAAFAGVLANPNDTDPFLGDLNDDALSQMLRLANAGGGAENGVSTLRWSTIPGTDTKIPHVPSANDALNAAGMYSIGVSWDAATKTEQNAIKRAYAVLDRQAMEQYGIPYRYLKGSQQSGLKSAVAGFSVQESDDPVVAKLNDIMLRERLAEDRYQRHLSQRLALNREEKAVKSMTAQPEALKAPTRQSASRGQNLSSKLKWDMVARLLGADASRLVSAWVSGQTGIAHLSPVRIRHLMALLPIAETPEEFASELRLIWASTAAPHSTYKTPSIGTLGETSNIRFRRRLS